MGERLVVVSNRGPVSYRVDEAGELVAKRGAGGLVSTLGPALQGVDATWVAAAISDGDREAARRGTADAGDLRVRLLAVDEDDYRRHYDVICNRTLWFAHHDLDDRASAPSLDRAWHEAWASFVRVNEAFADAVADEAPEGGTVLVQDLHLSLLGGMLAERRPDLATSHFAHTPFCWPDGLAVLPPEARRQLLEGLAGHGACGFHSPRWERAFLACCHESGVEPPRTFVAPAAADPGDVLGVATSEACDRHLEAIDRLADGRQVIARVDRMELSKNVVRGFQAYGLLLEEHPALRERTVFIACCYPSREGLAEYAAYRTAVEAAVEDLRARFGDVVHLLTDDDYPRSVAALRRADVVLVNPVRDGLNIVAKEALIAGERDPALCLSPEAGAWDELGDAGAIAAPPFDLVATAEALLTGLTLEPQDRSARAARLRAAATAGTNERWLAAQISAARRPGG